jgi:hypothetical protein
LKGLAPNGTYPVEVKTLNGSFSFDLARFKALSGSTNYFRAAAIFEQTDSYETRGLQAFACRYATQLSYGAVSELVAERCGGVSLSDQHIHHLVGQRRDQLGQIQQAFIDSQQGQSMPTLALADLYSTDYKELIWMEDGVCVSKQKAKRDKEAKSAKQRTITDSLLVAKPDGGFMHLVAAEGVDLGELGQAYLRQQYKGQTVRVVVVSDGSRTIKNRCVGLFESGYVQVLDWFHLQKKVRDLMTMIAPNKVLRTQYEDELVGLLWSGKVDESLTRLRSYAYRHEGKWQELQGYLEKNRTHIVDYQRRQAAGKLIGSGRMEKAGDMLLARRQKEKGMSWSPSGSNALAVLTAQYLNGATDYLQ